MPVKKFVKKMLFSQKLKFRDGKIKLFDIKAALLPISTVATMIEELYDRMEETGSEILFEVGKSQGNRAIDDVARDNNAGKREFVDKMVDLASVMGIGKWKVEKFDLDEEIRFSIEDSPLVSELQERDSLNDREKPVEELSHGIACGIGSNLLEGEIKSEILQSQFLGNKKTVIRVFKEEG
jgi:predicted hydrocarbon binding protein